MNLVMAFATNPSLFPQFPSADILIRIIKGDPL